MISNACKAYLLFVEPVQEASDVPVVDELTRKMAAAFQAATPSSDSWLGTHECICGAHSTSHNYVLPDVRATNSLCVHYLAFHRTEVPPEQLHEVSQLTCGESAPSEWELNGTKVLLFDELPPERQKELLERIHSAKRK